MATQVFQFSFEKLEVWKLANQLAIDVYKLTASFPAEEKYSLTSQIRRSAVSVCANLAEGSSRSTGKDQAHFTTVAFTSLMELISHLIISSDLGYFVQEELNQYKQRIKNLSVKLSNLRTSQLKRDS